MLILCLHAAALRVGVLHDLTLLPAIGTRSPEVTQHPGMDSHGCPPSCLCPNNGLAGIHGLLTGNSFPGHPIPRGRN